MLKIPTRSYDSLESIPEKPLSKKCIVSPALRWQNFASDVKSDVKSSQNSFVKSHNSSRASPNWLLIIFQMIL